MLRKTLAQIAPDRYQLDHARSAKEALAALEGERYDLCIVDYRLGVDDGLELIRTAARQAPTVAYLLLTGQGDHSIDMAAMDAGAVDYLAKDRLSPDVLEHVLRYAIRHQQLVNRLEQQSRRLLELATTDDLTGVLNRRSLNEQLQRAIDIADRHNFPLCFAIFDVDKFKSVNDRFGHRIGDLLLANLAQRLNRRLRTTDHFGRIGGDEFGIVLPHTTGQQALDVLSRLCETVAAKCYHVDDDTAFSTSITVGIAAHSTHCPADEMFCLADAALYEGKATGGNCVRLRAAPARQTEDPKENRRSSETAQRHFLDTARSQEIPTLSPAGRTSESAED